MKVKELIAALLEYPMESDVRLNVDVNRIRQVEKGIDYYSYYLNRVDYSDYEEVTLS